MIIYDQLRNMIQLRQSENNPPINDTTTVPEVRLKGVVGQTNMKIATFSLEEVAKHNTADDLWMIIHNKVYDITSIIDQHPGGAEVLFDFAGADGTASFDDVGHSQDSVEMLRPLFLGIVDKDGEASSEIELIECKGIVSNDIDEILMKIDDDYEEQLAPGIKYYNTLGAESERNNSSLGQSTYWKRYIQKKKEQKKGEFNYFGITDRNLNVVLIIVAILAFLAFINIQRLKWSDHHYQDVLDE